MADAWSFGRKVGLGFSVATALTVAIGITAVTSLANTIAAKDAVIDRASQVLVDCQQLETLAERSLAAARGYLITGEASYATARNDASEDFLATVQRLQQRVQKNRAQLDQAQQAFVAYQQASDALIAKKRANATTEEIAAGLLGEMRNTRQELTRAVTSLVSAETAELTVVRQDATVASQTASTLVSVMAVLAVAFCVVVAIALTKTLGRQIGSAVSQIQSSSTELQAAASQQAMGSREQATAVTEITTTIQELLATSRQIADSAQRVATMATQTSTSAASGERTVAKAQESIAGITRQVDLIVNHMLDLGRKSQQIGTVLDIVSELAEQTNILAINATIEASVAGEMGKRFGVVADEIRKLADRVTGSTKEVRSLIDEVRAAVNTTVMATETGAKTVDAGSRQFAEVTQSLLQIQGMVTTTTEAAREIELSTKQQASAVEQVSTAINSVAQATKETEASSTQTIQTVAQLATLSNALMRVVRPEAAR